MREFLNWLLDQTVRAEEKAAESSTIAPSSYGAGYDRGYADALIAVQNDGPVGTGSKT